MVIAELVDYVSKVVVKSNLVGSVRLFFLSNPHQKLHECHGVELHRDGASNISFDFSSISRAVFIYARYTNHARDWYVVGSTDHSFSHPPSTRST